MAQKTEKKGKEQEVFLGVKGNAQASRTAVPARAAEQAAPRPLCRSPASSAHSLWSQHSHSQLCRLHPPRLPWPDGAPLRLPCLLCSCWA